jgi:hypothetical protein
MQECGDGSIDWNIVGSDTSCVVDAHVCVTNVTILQVLVIGGINKN